MIDQNGIRLEVERRESAATVRLSGELDVATVPALAGTLDRLSDEGVSTVLLDLQGLSFVDVRGFDLLLRTNEAMKRQHRQLLVRSPSQAYLRVVDLLDVNGSAPPIQDGGQGHTIATDQDH